MSDSGWVWVDTKAGLPCGSQKAGKLGAHSGEGREGREGRELLPGTEQCQPGGWDAGKMKLLFLPFLGGYSQVVCSTVLLQLTK